MKEGNWIAIDKNLSKCFPDREFSKIDAAFSLTLDYDNNRLVTIAGYSKLWGWSRSKVRNFLDDMGVEIIYPEDTGKKQKQKGQIKRQIRDRSETEKGQIRMVDTKASQADEDRRRTEEGQKKDRSKDTTNKPSNNTNTNLPQNEFCVEEEKIKKVFEDDSLEMKIAVYFYKVLLKSDPKTRKPNFQNWCDCIDKILRIDGRTKEQVKMVIDYAHNPANSNDSFSWVPNLRSPLKLRKHFTTILLQCAKSPDPKISATLTAMPGAINV